MPATRELAENGGTALLEEALLLQPNNRYGYEELNALRLRPGRVLGWIFWRAGSKKRGGAFSHPGWVKLTEADLPGARKVIGLLEGMLIPYPSWHPSPAECAGSDLPDPEDPESVAAHSVIRVPVLRRLRLRRTRRGEWLAVAEGAVALFQSDPKGGQGDGGAAAEV